MRRGLNPAKASFVLTRLFIHPAHQTLQRPPRALLVCQTNKRLERADTRERVFVNSHLWPNHNDLRSDSRHVCSFSGKYWIDITWWSLPLISCRRADLGFASPGCRIQWDNCDREFAGGNAVDACPKQLRTKDAYTHCSHQGWRNAGREVPTCWRRAPLTIGVSCVGL